MIAEFDKIANSINANSAYILIGGVGGGRVGRGEEGAGEGDATCMVLVEI